MTTEQPTNHVLRRRADDRVIAGVASGLGDYLNVDPLLVRIGFVALMVFGGLGLILYVGAWLLLPADAQESSIVDQLLVKVGLSASRLVATILILIGGIVLFQALSNGSWAFSFAPWVPVASVVIVAGVVMLRQGATVARDVVAEPVVAAPVRPARRRAKRPPSPLGWYALAGVFGAIGLLALAANLLTLDVNPGQFFGMALAVVGIGLVVGAWWGRARILILLGILILPVAVTASFVTAPIEGGLGDQRFQPASSAELRDAYRLVGGRLELDLTRIQPAAEPIVISASVAVGQLRVTLPPDATVEADSAVGAGDLLVLGTQQIGSGLTDRYVHLSSTGPHFILDLQAGIGEVVVYGGPVGGR